MPFLGPLCAIALVVGALIGAATPLAPSTLLWFLPALLLCSVVVWWLGVPRLLVALLIGGICVTGAALGADARERAVHPRLRGLLDAAYGGFAIETMGPEGPHAADALRFELTEDAAENGDIVSLRAVARSILLNGSWHPLPDEGVWLTVGGAVSRDRVSQWRAGRVLLAPVAFRRPARYLNDGVPDAERDLALDGTALLGSVKSGLLVQVERSGTELEEAAASVRAYVRGVVARWVTSRDPVAGAIAIAVLIGDRTGLPDEIRARLQSAGTYHVIAISGGNIAILAGLALFTLLLLGVQGRTAAFVTIVVLITYSQIVTAGPSVWRATLMAVLYLSARLLDHRTSPWNAMAVAAALMVAARPLDVRDPGFILTFGATSALLEGARWAQRLTSRRDRVPSTHASPVRTVLRAGARWVLASLVASLSVELVLLPVSAAAFSRVTVAGVVLNLLAVPLMALVQMAGIALAFVAEVPRLASVAGWIAYASAKGLVESARLVDALPGLAERVPSPGFAVVLVYYVGLAALLWPRRPARWVGGIALAVSAVAIVAGAPAVRGLSPSLSDTGLRLTVFDVGQAEAMLLQTAGAEPLIVDTGGTPFGSGRFDVGRSRARAGTLGARYSNSGDARHHARRSRSHRGRRGAHRRLRSETALDRRAGAVSRADTGAVPPGRTRQHRGGDAARRSRTHMGSGTLTRAAPARARLGTSARPERRFGRDRGSPWRHCTAPDGRHRRGGRTVHSSAPHSCATPDPEGSPSR